MKNFVGYEHLHLRDGAIYLDKRGVKINLGDVGKDYGIDLARKIFTAHGIHDVYSSRTIHANHLRCDC